jgi:phosphoribosylformimino-5-aminoimidazole carboxamide ribotide isomerase
MLVIPAIDLKGGAVVRLYQGRAERETRYASDAVTVAREWQEQGAQWLHVVDLDAAFSGRPQHLEVLSRLVSAFGGSIQFGGGLRSADAIEAVLEIGVERAILGSVALSNPKLVQDAVAKHKEKIVVAIDARAGKVCTSGWQEDLEASPIELASCLKTAGITRIVYTDITRDGTLTGLNVEATERMARETGLAVIASGGVSTLDDIRRLRPLQEVGVEGVIVGKALYEKRFTLKAANQVAKE